MKTISNWSPLHFLAPLGAGGIVVTFFMFLLFWVPHPNQPIPVYEDWMTYFQVTGLYQQAIITAAIAGIGIFFMLHLRWLWMNIRQFQQFKAEGNVEKIIGTNAHTQIMALPLTFAMTINASFIVGAVFIPGLWGFIEILFPLAMVLFVVIGIWALHIYLSFFSHVLHHASFDTTANNSLAQLLPSFTFAMTGVGLAAPAAMSNTDIVIGLSFLGSLFFITIALFLGVIKLVIGMGDMFREGTSRTTLPTLWVVIPILTVTGIAMMRLGHGLHTLELSHGNYIVSLSVIFSIQIMFVLMGWAVMKRMNYFQALFGGEEKSPVAFALICPGVALVVMGHFILNKVFVISGIITKFDGFYIGFSSALVILQIATIWLLLRIGRDHFGSTAQGLDSLSGGELMK